MIYKNPTIFEKLIKSDSNQVGDLEDSHQTYYVLCIPRRERDFETWRETTKMIDSTIV